MSTLKFTVALEMAIFVSEESRASVSPGGRAVCQLRPGELMRLRVCGDGADKRG